MVDTKYCRTRNTRGCEVWQTWIVKSLHLENGWPVYSGVKKECDLAAQKG